VTNGQRDWVALTIQTLSPAAQSLLRGVEFFYARDEMCTCLPRQKRGVCDICGQAGAYDSKHGMFRELSLSHSRHVIGVGDGDNDRLAVLELEGAGVLRKSVKLLYSSGDIISKVIDDCPTSLDCLHEEVKNSLPELVSLRKTVDWAISVDFGVETTSPEATRTSYAEVAFHRADDDLGNYYIPTEPWQVCRATCARIKAELASDPPEYADTTTWLHDFVMEAERRLSSATFSSTQKYGIDFLDIVESRPGASTAAPSTTAPCTPNPFGRNLGQRLTPWVVERLEPFEEAVEAPETVFIVDSERFGIAAAEPDSERFGVPSPATQMIWGQHLEAPSGSGSAGAPLGKKNSNLLEDAGGTAVGSVSLLEDVLLKRGRVELIGDRFAPTLENLESGGEDREKFRCREKNLPAQCMQAELSPVRAAVPAAPHSVACGAEEELVRDNQSPVGAVVSEAKKQVGAGSKADEAKQRISEIALKYPFAVNVILIGGEWVGDVARWRLGRNGEEGPRKKRGAKTEAAKFASRGDDLIQSLIAVALPQEGGGAPPERAGEEEAEEDDMQVFADVLKFELDNRALGDQSPGDQSEEQVTFESGTVLTFRRRKGVMFLDEDDLEITRGDARRTRQANDYSSQARDRANRVMRESSEVAAVLRCKGIFSPPSSASRESFGSSLLGDCSRNGSPESPESPESPGSPASPPFESPFRLRGSFSGLNRLRVPRFESAASMRSQLKWTFVKFLDEARRGANGEVQILASCKSKQTVAEMLCELFFDPGVPGNFGKAEAFLTSPNIELQLDTEPRRPSEASGQDFSAMPLSPQLSEVMEIRLGAVGERRIRYHRLGPERWTHGYLLDERPSGTERTGTERRSRAERRAGCASLQGLASWIARGCGGRLRCGN